MHREETFLFWQQGINSSQIKPTFQLSYRKTFYCLRAVKSFDRSEVRYLTVAASAARTLDRVLDNKH